MKRVFFAIGLGLMLIAGCGKKENHEPVLTSPRNFIIAENSDFNYQATASDPENQLVVINYANYPDWLIPVDTHLSGRAPWGLAETTAFGFNVLVSDGYNETKFPITIAVYPENVFYLSFYPQQRQIEINNTAAFTIGLNNVHDLFAISFDIICDTFFTRVTDVDVPPHNLLDMGGVYFYHSIPGGVSIFMGRTQTPENDNLNGGGPLINVSFRGIAAGASSIGFYNVLIVDENGAINNNMDELVRGSAAVYVR